MTVATLNRIRADALATLRPPPRLPLSTWAEGNVVLPQEVASVSGPLRLHAYQRGIADAISAPEVERVTLVKAVRVGLSSLITATIASYVANEPCPILALLPTEADCRDYVVSDVEPIFAASPNLAGLLTADADETGRSTLLARRFPGGSLKIVAAKAPRNLRRHNARVLVVDEADAMEAGAEGDPITLAERRTLSFPNRKIVLGSTPVTEETSPVLRAYAASDRRVFEVPCASCGAFTEILWAHIEWAPEQPETAAFRCPHCKELVPERHKAGMVAQGRWRATAPHVVGHAGFRLNALVSPLHNARWGVLAAEWLAAQGKPDKLQPFINTILAQGWRETAEALDGDTLAARGEPFSLDAIPAEVLWITAGVDCQDDRLEATLLGHTRDGDVLTLAHVVIWGAFKEDTTFAELDDLLMGQWSHPLGGTIRVDAACVDSGDGDHTARVLAFCHARFSRRVLAIKGVQGEARPPLDQSRSQGSRLFIVGVDTIKTRLLRRLAHGASIRFSSSLNGTYFEQLTSERRTLRYHKGQPSYVFERIPGRRAEALDSTVYALAAREVIRQDPDRRTAELSQPAAAPTAAPAPRVLRSRFLSGGGPPAGR